MAEQQNPFGIQFRKNLENYLAKIDSINDTLPFVTELIDMNNNVEKTAVNKFFNEHAIKKEITTVTDTPEGTGSKEEIVRMSVADYLVFEGLNKNAKVAKLSLTLIPESLFVTLISQFDAFIGDLIKIIFKAHPEKLFSSEKNIPFKMINEFTNIDEIKGYLIEKEVESVLRESHESHFEWLENKLGIPLRSDLPIWKTYMEITERRNLLVHNNGIVSSQYLLICNKSKCDVSNKSVGDKLTVSLDYFKAAYFCLYELAVKLTQVTWRHELPDDLDHAGTNLNNICYDLIHNELFDLADTLLSFATDTLKKHSDEKIKHHFLINKALSKYLAGKKDISDKILNAKDWSASGLMYQVAVNTLLENYPQVYDGMLKIGRSNEIPKHSYQAWPLFIKIREEKQFQDTFKTIFDEEYNVIERPSKAISQLLDVFTSKKKKIVAQKRLAKKTANELDLQKKD